MNRIPVIRIPYDDYNRLLQEYASAFKEVKVRSIHYEELKYGCIQIEDKIFCAWSNDPFKNIHFLIRDGGPVFWVEKSED